MERLLSSPQAGAPTALHGRAELKRALTELLQEIRLGGSHQEPPQVDIASLVERAARRLADEQRFPLRRLINATGIIIHTNLGRAPVSRSILGEAEEIIRSYSNLELDLATGQRGSRNDHLTSLAQRLFGCEAALLTNNNAGATLLALAAIAGGGEVIVSRGELVEIGGGFRVPDVIQQGGARLREVGTTNRTRASDYAAAVDSSTAALLRVHRSNFEIVGFTEQPSIGELVEVAKSSGKPLIYDEGSGRVIDLQSYGFERATTLAELFGEGVDLVTCSTDKLIGATQGGLILGSAALVSRCAKHPLMRALRAGKESFGIVAATLRSFVRQSHERDVAIYTMLAQDDSLLRSRATTLAARLQGSVREVRSALGGGTTPTETIASWGVALNGAATETHRRLLQLDVPIVSRIEDDTVLLDLRTIDPADDELVAAQLERELRG